MIGGAAQAGAPYLIGVIIDDVRAQASLAELRTDVFIFIGLSLVAMVAFFGQRHFSGTIAYAVVYDIRKVLFDNMLKLDQRFFQRYATGDLISRMYSDTTMIMRLNAIGFNRFGSAAFDGSMGGGGGAGAAGGFPGGFGGGRGRVLARLVDESAIADGEHALVARPEVRLGEDAVRALVLVDLEALDLLLSGDAAGPDRHVVRQFLRLFVLAAADVDGLLVDLRDEVAGEDVDVRLLQSLPERTLQFGVVTGEHLV